MGFYDEQIKELYANCPRLVILSINSIFGKQHKENAEVVYLNRELPGGKGVHAQYMDMYLGIEDSRYHLEFQMKEDYMAIRMYEYAVKETLREAKMIRGLRGKTKYELELYMPQQAVIFLTGVNSQDKIKVTMTLPNGKKASYVLPCVSTAQDIAQLIDRQLYIFVPFQLVKEHKRLLELKDKENENALPDDKKKALDHDRSDAAEMVYNYQRKVRIALENLVEGGKISTEEVDELYEVYKNIEHEMIKESKKILAEVTAMGPEVKETYSQQLRREGRAEGKAEGRAEMIRNLLESGMAPEEVASRTKVELKIVLEIQNTVLV